MTPESELGTRAYLLGELPDDRVAALEKALLADPELLDQVQQVETDLIDDYVDDRLSASERTRFESYYLASQIHRDRVALARALAMVGREASSPDLGRPEGRPLRTTLVWASAAAVLLVVGWLATRSGSSGPGVAAPPTVAEAPSSPPPSVPEPDRAPTAEPPSPSAAPVRVALQLAPVVTRGSGATPRLVVPPDAAFVDLRLGGPRPQRTPAAAEIRSVEDRLAWTGTAEPASGSSDNGQAHAWVASVPADRLAADDYILTLSDARAEVIARYFFRIARAR
jgi:hypothetical protein